MPVYFTKPIPRPALWGGTLLRDYFRYPDFPDNIGQSWSFSGQDGAASVLANGDYEGQTLSDLWREKPSLFNSRFAQLPVIISLVAPMEDLSIQIHPNAEIAAESGYAMGKNEAWYFLDAVDGGDIVYGLNAKDEPEVRGMIAADRWDELVSYLPVHKDDFVYLPAGMLHALRKGSIVYEIQQATDITYRFYDYHRKDASGQERELHVEQAIRCIDYRLTQTSAHPEQTAVQLTNSTLTTLIANDSFCVRRLCLNGQDVLCMDGYQLMTVCRGNGTVNGQSVQIGQSFLVPAMQPITLTGDMLVLMTGEM